MIIADSHEFIELYRGDKDLRIGMEMLKLDPELQFVSFAPDRPSPNDAERFGISRTAEGPLPVLPARFDLQLLPSHALRFARRESGGIVSVMPSYGSRLRALRPDVIFENPFSWLTPRSYQTYAASKRLRAPVVYYDPGDDIPVSRRQRFLAPLERTVVNHAAHIITYNDAGRRRFESKYGYPAEWISVIPKPVDVMACRYEGDVRDLRADLGGGEGVVLIGYLGRLARYKGSRVLLDVARRALEDATMAQCRFVFLGGALATEEDEKEYRLPNTRVTGMILRDDVPRYIACCDVLAFPDITHPGGFPTAVAECMAAGKPLILGLGDRTDYVPVTDGETAMIVEPGSVEHIARAVAALAQDGAKRLRLGETVGRYAQQNMDYPVVASAYFDIANKVRRHA